MGCVTVSPIMSAGPDTYMVYAGHLNAHGSSFRARRYAQRAAEKYCANMDRRMEHVSTAIDMVAGSTRATAEMTFRCVAD